MPKVDETIINFAVYEDGTEYYGLAKVTLPDISSLTNSISGAGISGNYDAVTLGHIEAMTLTLSFRTITEAAVRLTEPRRHNIDLRVAQQQEDTVAGQIETRAVKHVLVVTPKKLGAGNVAPASAADVSGEYSVSYFATFIDGTKMLEVDPFNFIYYVNGTDYLAAARTALGK